jgi:hypothetical protein
MKDNVTGVKPSTIDPSLVQATQDRLSFQENPERTRTRLEPAVRLWPEAAGYDRPLLAELRPPLVLTDPSLSSINMEDTP